MRAEGVLTLKKIYVLQQKKNTAEIASTSTKMLYIPFCREFRTHEHCLPQLFRSA